MSSLVDNILLLNFVELGDTFRVALTIGKMRSNAVNRASREVEVTDGQGMRVIPRVLPAALSKSAFSRYQGLISRAPERRPPQLPREAEE